MFAMSVSDESELSGTPPSRPGQPRARVLGSRSVELVWEPPQAGAASIVGYCVHGRRGGEGGFVPIVRHTGDAMCRSTVSVEPGSWHEFTVAALSGPAENVGPHSRASKPVLTPKASGRRGGGASDAASGSRASLGESSGGRRRRRGRRRTTRGSDASGGSSDGEGAAAEGRSGGGAGSHLIDARLEREYAELKAATRAWDLDFARLHGRQPTAEDRLSDADGRRLAKSVAKVQPEVRRMRARAAEAAAANEEWQRGLRAAGLDVQARPSPPRARRELTYYSQ